MLTDAEICALLFDSVHYVLEAEKRLEARGIERDVIPVPKQVSPDCGVALQIRLDDRPQVLALLDDLSLHFKSAWRLRREGDRLAFVERL